MQSTPSQGLTQVLIWIVIAGLLIFRLSRPQKFTTTRLFIMPILLIALTAFAIWGNAVAAAQTGAAPAAPLAIALALVAGVLAGIPVGVLRGKHSEVRPTDRRGVMYVHSSPAIIIIWLAVFAVRSLIRYLMPHAGSLTAVVSDGLMGFAIAALIASYVVILRRYNALPQPAPAQ